MIPLSPSDEHDLIRRYQAGAGTTPDARRAGDALLRMHRGFIYLMAQKQFRHGRDNESVLQEARLGFLEGVSRFDFERGVDLTSWAQWGVWKFTDRWITGREYSIRVPRQHHHHTGPTKSGRPRKTSRANAAALALRSGAFASLSQKSHPDAVDCLGDLLASDRESPEEVSAIASRQARMEVLAAEALRLIGLRSHERLRGRNQAIVWEILTDEEARTFQEIADGFSITKQRVDQVRERALVTMRGELMVDEWGDFERWIEEAPIRRREQAA